MKLFYSVLSLCFILSLCSCNADSPTKDKITTTSETADKVEAQMQGHYPMWAKNANMYEVNIRQFTEEGTFNAFTNHVARLQKIGVDILWFMPVYPISETKKKGTLGSYYAISDYTKVNPEFGTLEDFQKMVKAIHNAGMKIILDFVPNHTGWDHTWISEHPEYYSQDKEGNIIDPIDPNTGKSWGWTDVADLNFDNKEMRQHMINDMLYWIEKEQIDGYRMDVAHGVPVDFWGEVSASLVKAKADIFMLAESEVPDLRNKKYFQTDYGWAFHHLLNDVAKGEKGPKEIQDWYSENQSKYQEGWHIQFTSNHDENSWSGSTKERMGEAHDALAALAFTIEGMPLIYGGQEEPLVKRLEFFEKDNIGFDKYAKADFYQKMLKVKHENESLWNGVFGGKANFLKANDQVLAFKREKNGVESYCIFNLSEKPATLDVDFDSNQLKNVMNESSIAFKSGSKMELAAWDFRIYSSI